MLRPVFLMAESGQISAIASAVSLTEVLTLPLRAGDTRLATRYRRGLIDASDISLVPVSPQIADLAAQIRAEKGWRTPDALVAATALDRACDILISNDERFKQLRGLRALFLNDFVPKGAQN